MSPGRLSSLAVTALALLSSAADWPMLGRDNTRNAVSPEKGAPLDWQIEKRTGGKVVRPARNIKWMAELGTADLASPTIAGGLVWVGTNNERPRDPKVKGDAAVLMCFRESDGKFLWQYVSPRLKEDHQDFARSGLNCSPLAEGERLYFTTNRAEVVCLDVRALQKGTGEPRVVWKLDMVKQLGISPLRDTCPVGGHTCSIAGRDGRLFVTTGHGARGELGAQTWQVSNPKAPSLICVDAKTGKVLWQDASPGKGILRAQWSSPLVVTVQGRAQVIVGQGDGWVRSFDPVKGTPLWQFDTNAKGSTYRYVGGGDRNPVLATPVLANGLVYVVNGRDYAEGSGPGRTWCIDPTGEGDVSPELEGAGGKGKRNPKSRAVWLFDRYELDGEDVGTRATASLVVHDGLALLATQNGYLHCLDAKTGKRYWTHDLEDETVGTPLIVDKTIYLGGNTGTVVVLALGKKKQVLATRDMRGSVRAAPVFANGVLYLVSEGKLYAIQAPAPRARGDWPMLGRDNTRNAVSPEKGAPLTWQFEQRSRERVVRPAHNIKWTAEIGRFSFASPVVAGGLIWIGTSNDRPRDAKVKGDAAVLMCFRESDGQFLWQYVSRPGDDHEASLTCSPLAEGDRLYFTTNRLEVVCLDVSALRMGGGAPRVVWKLDMIKELGVSPVGTTMNMGRTSSIAARDGRLYVTTNHGVKYSTGALVNPRAPSLICVDAKTGKVIWQDASPGKAIMGRQWSSPLVVTIKGRAQVIVGQGDGWVRSFDPVKGTPLWQFDTNPKGSKYKDYADTGRNPVLATPVLAGGLVYVVNGREPDEGGGSGRAWCIDPTGDGDVSPELEGADGKGKRNPKSRAVWLFDGFKHEGEHVGMRSNASVVVHDGLALLAAQNGYLHCVDAKTGKRYWTHDLEESMWASPLIADGKIYAGGSGGCLVVLALSKQKHVLAATDLGSVLAAPVFANGTLYLVSSSKLYAIQAPAPRTRGDWPMLGRDNTRNAVSPEKGAPLTWQVEERANGKVVRRADNIKWTAELGSVGMASPTVAGGLVWVGTNNQRPRDPKVKGDAAVLMCFRESDGQFLWQYVSARLPDRRGQDWPEAGINCSPLAEGERLYFTTNRGEVVCLDVAALQKGTGLPRVVWKLDMVKELGVSPVGAAMGVGYTCSIASRDGRLFVTTGHGVEVGSGTKGVANPKAPSLICVDAKTGKVIWQDGSPGKGILSAQWSSPLVVTVKGRAQVIVGQGDGWVRSFDPVKGTPLWQFDTNPKGSKYVLGRQGERNPVLATPVLANGLVYVQNGREPEHGSGAGRAWCIDPTGEGDVSPELEGPDGKARRNPKSRAVWLFDRWGEDKVNAVRMRSHASIVVHEGLAFIPLLSGYLHCVDAKTGKRHWTHDLKESIFGSPLIVDGKIYLSGDQGSVVVLALSKKEQVLANMEMPSGPIRATPVFSNGVLYLIDRGTLYAIQGRDITARAPGHWPQWRGPDRTNRSAEKGLLKQWPKEGPPLAWKVTGAGEAPGTVAVAGGRIYLLGMRGEHECLTALAENSGKPLWSVALAPAVKLMPAMRWLSQRTPLVDGDRVYAVTAAGELVCVAAANGAEKWRKNYSKDFAGRWGGFGLCDHLLIDGDKLICVPGGKTATVVALNKADGKVLWKCPLGHYTQYGAAIVTEAGGQRHYVVVTSGGLTGISTDGKKLWEHTRFSRMTANCCTPVPVAKGLFAGGNYGKGVARLELSAKEGGVAVTEQYHKNLAVPSWHESILCVGKLAFVGTNSGMVCLELDTGKQLWAEERGKGVGGIVSLTYAEGHLYLRNPRGEAALVEASPKEYVLKGRFTLPEVKSKPGATAPVIAAGRLYLRDDDRLFCYDIAEGARPGKPATYKVPEATRPPQGIARAKGKLEAIYVPTPQDVVDRMLELAAPKKSEVVTDLGCGDGRIVVTAARKYGCKAIGYELDPEVVRLAEANVKKHKVEALVTIERKDLFTVDLSQMGVVALYLGTGPNEKLLPRLAKLKAGARVVCHAFPLPGIVADRVVTMKSAEDGADHKVYLYTVPLKKEK